MYRDFDYVVNDKNKLSDMICELILGNDYHIQMVIKELDPNYPDIDKKSIEYQINRLKKGIDQPHSADTYKIDGWLFQMISWLALVIQHKDERFFLNSPHSQPAMHGLDGLAITLKEDNTIERIIITEDKCTDNPRYTIKNLVFPEFLKFENESSINSSIQQTIRSLVGAEGYFIIQNDIRKKEYRQYRIGITREEAHNSQAGRNNLFAGYDECIEGTDVNRRTGSSIYIPNMREWMLDLRKQVITKLEEKLR